MSAHNYSLWLDEGHGAAGNVEYNPANDFCPIVIYLGLGETPDSRFGGIRIYCRKEADIRSVAKAFRNIAEGIERTMFPPLIAEDLAGLPGLPLGVIDYE